MYYLSIFSDGRNAKLCSWLISLSIMKQLKHCYWGLFKMVFSVDLVVKTRPLHTIAKFGGVVERGEGILLGIV